MTAYNCDFCVCKDQRPEEIKRGVIVCLNCNMQVNPADITDYGRDLTHDEELAIDQYEQEKAFI